MLRQLDERTSHGIVVELLYDKKTKTVTLVVKDHDTEYEPVVVEDARDAFDHPFLYVSDVVEQPVPEPQSRRASQLTDADLFAAAAGEWHVDDEGGEEAMV